MNRFVIFGPGRVGVNLAALVRDLGHPVTVVSRRDAFEEPAKCRALIDQASVVAAAIPDKALQGWATEWRPYCADRYAIHFSGATQVDGMWGYHPLYSFPAHSLPPTTLNLIAVARQPGAPLWRQIVPGAENPEFVVANEDRALYHALAVLSGNFAAFLWNEASREMAQSFGLEPGRVLAPYVAGVVDRFRESPENSLTGPIARKDRVTVESNLAALAGAPRLEALYRAFLAAAWPDWEREK